MKRFNRDINIFNLSMMDVISGAMGAFLILVVILARHYNSEVINTQRILDLQKELVEATGNLTDVSEEVAGNTMDTSQIERSLEAAKANVDRSKQHVAALYEELQEANATIELQEEEIETLNSQLERYQPFFVMAKWECDRATAVGMYLWNDSETADTPDRPSRPMPEFDPTRTQTSFFTEELYQGLQGTRFGMEVWVNIIVDANHGGKLYFRINSPEHPLTECEVTPWLVSKGNTISLGSVSLSPTQPWIYMGDYQIDDDKEFSFNVATDSERAAERRRLGGP